MKNLSREVLRKFSETTVLSVVQLKEETLPKEAHLPWETILSLFAETEEIMETSPLWEISQLVEFVESRIQSYSQKPN
jgi:hypothetical protein